MAPLDRNCSLLFDEISLSTGINYDQKNDKIDGLASVGSVPVFADHALVFMACGQKRKLKQPIAYYFSESCVKSDQLVVLIKELISALQNIGLIVRCTISDQFVASTAAISKLEAQTRADRRKLGLDECFGYMVNNSQIYHLYDTPHLIKGIRNNLLTKNCHYIQDGVKKIAKWEDIQKFYELDGKTNGNYRCCNRLTDAHIYREKIKMMKVKNATFYQQGWQQQ